MRWNYRISKDGKDGHIGVVHHDADLLPVGGSDPGPVAICQNWLSHKFNPLSDWSDQARRRSHLKQVSDHVLRDIGLSRADVVAIELELVEPGAAAPSEPARQPSARRHQPVPQRMVAMGIDRLFLRHWPGRLFDLCMKIRVVASFNAYKAMH